MIGPGQQPDYTKGEKVVNCLAKIPLAMFGALAWLIRKIKKPYWDK